MARRGLGGFARSDSGAVAATYALALSGIIVAAGVGFDYSRMATLDSELQNGADQAALAGATQLDGQSGACSRAAARASSLVNNLALLAQTAHAVTISNEGGCDAVGSIRFYQDKNGATPATSDANARYIGVKVDQRTTNYAFTPIGGLMYGTLQAAAVAGLGSSVCKVPPVFMCNPAQGTDPTFTVDNYKKKGIRLIANDGGGGYGPGNFGYLEAGAGNGANAIRDALGRETVPGDCVSADSVTTKPGAQVSVLDALNTRFDVYANGLTSTCGGNNAQCPPSANTRKDLMHKGNSNQCAFTNGGGNGWSEAPNPYKPTSATVPLTPAEIAPLSPMGYPRDMCHAVSLTGSCAGGSIGTGTWDRNAYFKTNSTNYAAGFDIGATFGTTEPSRYQVYKYEAANAATRLQTQSRGGAASISAPYCRQPGVPVGGTATTPDRRVIPVAVINCGAGINGSTAGLQPVKWIDVFLVEPSVTRGQGTGKWTEQSDVYVEVIGDSVLGGGGAAAQLIRRDVPYLIK